MHLLIYRVRRMQYTYVLISRVHQPRQPLFASAARIYVHGLGFPRTILPRLALTSHRNVSISVLPSAKVFVIFGYLRQV